MHMTDFELGERSPGEFIDSRYLFQQDRSGKEGNHLLSPKQKRIRQGIAVAAVAELGEHQKVAEYLGIHATSVTRWVNGHTVVPAHHMRKLLEIVYPE